MSIKAPQASSQEKRGEMLDRLVRFGNEDPRQDEGSVQGTSRLFLAAACVLSLLGMLLSLCSIAIVADPESTFASLLLATLSLLS